MTTSSDDLVIDADLTALGDASRRDLTALDGSLRTTGVYRDDRPGAEARRKSLADERRRELALMPLTLSHLYAHRIARATAGAVAVACAVALLLALSDPLLLRLTAWFIPGFAIGMFGVIACAVVLGAYVVATWVAEYRFERQMRRSIGTGGDVYRDLDQLAEGPFAVAATSVRRLDRSAITLPLAGLVTLVPMLAYVSFVATATYSMRSPWDSPRELLHHALSSNLGPVVFAIAIALGLAAALGRACDQERRGGATAWSLRWLGTWHALLAGGVVGLASLYGAFTMAYNFQLHHRLPSEGARFALALGGVFSVLLISAFGLLWWRRRERIRLGDDDLDRG